MTNIPELTFLVVEDQGFQNWHCANVLRGLGAKHILSAQDGRAALELLNHRSAPIDVVISDLNMPEMDGMALIRKVAERNLASSLIIMSSLERPLMASVETMAQAYGIRVLGAMEKPVTVKKLQALLALLEAPSKEVHAPGATPAFTAEEVAEGLRNNQFEAFFQPKVDVMTRALKGAEALARWRHPEHVLVHPAAFLQTLEAAGLVDELTWRMLRSAAENCRAWRATGVDVNVSVNLAVATLADVSFADRAIEVVRDVGLESRHVIFEVTESAAARELGRSLETLTRLRMKGFGLSIDDYGTGYSSMQRLSRVPFTELKIDQSFVKNAATQASSRAFVESSLQLASKLGIGAVAEGVEGHREWELLLSLGCPVAQGYYIAQPMDAAEFLDWVRAQVRGRVSA
jgi:EAL domain-containing protein (putative c-di-GMP-specific phosphodiesterase class I)/DNA-binding NarL/FixJ family response regulator